VTTLAEARRRWRETISQYQQVQQIRSAVLGDGRGTATSNLFVPNRDNYVFARDDVSSTRYFQILNRGVVQPSHNLPVLIGFPEPGESDQEEQIISMHYAGLGDIPASTIPIVGPHHQQHEWHGGDEVFIDPLQFLPGLVYPTYPSSMIANVRSFIYFWDTWQRFPFTQTDDLTQFKPSSGQIRYVLIGLDPEADILVYRPGVPYATGTQEIIYDLFTPVPAPAGNEIPLGYVKLASTTTVVDWSSVVDNMRDARLFPSPPALHLLDRIKQLEGLSGNPPDLMMVGSASASDSGDNTLNGLADVDTTGAVTDQVLIFSSGRWIPGNTAGTGTVTGTGTANHVAYWSASSAITGNSTFQFNGSTFGIGVPMVSSRFVYISQPAISGTHQNLIYVLGGAHTSLTANGEATDIYFALSRTVQWLSGDVTTQRAVIFEPPTYAFTGTSTITTAATVAITGAPVAGTNATITNPLALWIQAGRVLLGTAATVAPVGIELAQSVTAAGGQALGLYESTILTAIANSDALRGLQLNVTYAKGAFTGLAVAGINIGVPSVSGSGTISTYAALVMAEATIATANVGLLIGTHPGGSTNYAMYISTSNSNVITGAGLQMGAPTGGDKGSGTINVATNIYLNNSAYGNPDYALEYWLTDHINRYATNRGAEGYQRLSLDEIESYIKENMRLPRITDEPSGIFDRADIALEKIEEIFTHLIELHKRIRSLESVEHS